MAFHYASCTGEAILLVNALRAVGVPARMVGTPCWNDGVGGNHDWVEVWFDNAWSFTEPENTSFNNTWFYPYPAKYAVPGYQYGIFAASYVYQPGYTHFPMTWAPNDPTCHGIDVTESYTG